MEARIKSNDLEPEFKVLSAKHQLLFSKAESKPASEWTSEARRLQQELTLLWRKIEAWRPLTSTERIFHAEARAKVMGYLSYWSSKLK